MSSDDPRYRIAVLDESGAHLFWASEEHAKDLVKAHQVTLIRRHGRTVALRAVCGVVEDILELAGKGTALGGVRYSDNYESEDNPAGVWTLRRLAGDRALYNRVTLSVYAA